MIFFFVCLKLYLRPTGYLLAVILTLQTSLIPFLIIVILQLPAYFALMLPYLLTVAILLLLEEYFTLPLPP